jgi:hypothetical protein
LKLRPGILERLLEMPAMAGAINQMIDSVARTKRWKLHDTSASVLARTIEP